MTRPPRKPPKEGTAEWYSQLYGLPLQTVINARKRGWPLKDPRKLLELMLKAPGKKPPLAILEKIVNGEVEEPSEADIEGTTEIEETGDTVFDESMVLRSGLLHELKRLQEETMKSYRLYLSERRPGDRLTRQKIYLNNVAALRMLAKEAPKAEREAKNVLVRADVDGTWSRTLKEFKTTIEQLGRRIATDKLFHKLDPVDVEQIITTEVNGILAQLESGSWLTQKSEK